MKYKLKVNADYLGIEYVLDELELCGLEIIRGEIQYVIIENLEQLQKLVHRFGCLAESKNIYINDKEIEIDFINYD